MSDVAIFSYKCDNYYSKDHEGGIHYHDPILDIDWQIPPDQLVVSTKDKQLPFWGHHTPILSK